MTRTLQSTLVIAALCLPVHALAAPIFFDFGDGARQTAGNYNNISVSTPISLSVADAVDAAGASTGIGLTASGFYNGSNQSGPTVPTGDAAIFDGEATRDNAFGHAGAFGTNPLTPLALLDITGLDPAKQYSFVFFGSRIPASNNRETQFEVVGANSALAALNPSNNSSDVANVLGISPTAAGTPWSSWPANGWASN